jgi:predicted oxidoreductase (fatty acid repression mutant protein)
MASTISFLEAIAKRRSVYTLTNSSPIPQERITELVREALKYCPSACRSDSSQFHILDLYTPREITHHEFSLFLGQLEVAVLNPGQSQRP